MPLESSAVGPYVDHVLHRAHVGLAMVFLAVLLVSGSRALAQGGGIVLYENGSPDMGHSYAGAGARAEDAGTVFSNPAGMMRIENNQLLLGTMAIFTDFKIDLDSSTISVPPGSTAGGGQAGSFAPGLGSFMVMPLSENLTAGFTVNALAATGVNYDPGWVGRAFITENFLIAANFQPTIAYRINEKLSIGAGLNIVYMRLDQEFKASNLATAATIKIDDASDWGLGGSFGLLYEASERTRFGLTYRTEIDFSLEGDLNSPLPASLDFGGDFKLVQGFNVSMYHGLNDRLAILADAGWSDWSEFGRIPTTFGPVSVTQERDWDDTWRVGLGLEYMLDDTWMLRTGFSFDSSPVDDDKRLPDIPVGDAYRFSVGVQKDFGSGKRFGLSYTFIYVDMDLDGIVLPPSGAVTLDGSFENAYLHILGFQVAIDF